MSGSQRRKGAAGERELCAEMAKIFPGETPKRTLGQARDGGYDIPLGALRIEAKRRKSLKGLYDWMKQAAASIHPFQEGLVPAVMCRADDEEWLVIIRLKDVHQFTSAVREIQFGIPAELI